MNLTYKPKWFKLEDYLENTDNLSAQEWGEVLNLRIYLWNYLNGKYENHDINRDYAKSILDTIIPFRRPKRRTRTIYGISPMNMERLAIYWSYFSELKNTNGLAKKLLDNEYNPKNSTEEERALIETPLELLDNLKGMSFLDSLGEVLISVDPMVSEEQLVADFKKWLSQCKKRLQLNPKGKNYSHKELQSWHKKRLLPYIDLLIDSTFQGISLTQCQLGNLLFPDEGNVDTTERIRKTTAIDAMELLKEETFLTLRSQGE